LKKKKNKLASLAIFFLLVSLPSCRPKVEKQVSQFLDDCIAAVNAKDAPKFLDCFDPGYADDFFAPDQARLNIKKELAQELAPSCRVLKREVKAGQGKAAVDQTFRLEGLIAGGKRSYQEQEKLVLKREGQGWKIVSGSGLYSIFAGHAAEEDSIKAVLEKRVRALHTKDLELFKQVVDPDYSFKGKDFDQVVGQMREYFKNYDSIELSLDEPRIRFHSGRADCVEGYRMKATQNGRTKDFNDTEKLEMRKTPEGWKISKGL
jgi:ketosteroid isomerase-like protein